MQLPANATLEHTPALAAELLVQVQGASGVLRVDASGLSSFDSSTIALLLQARRTAEAVGRSFAVTGAPKQLVALAELYGVADLLSMQGDS